MLIDWSQNDPHKTTASVYSVRARERPTASTPVEWEELEAALEAQRRGRPRLHRRRTGARVAAKGDLYAPLLTQRQELPDLTG